MLRHVVWYPWAMGDARLFRTESRTCRRAPRRDPRYAGERCISADADRARRQRSERGHNLRCVAAALGCSGSARLALHHSTRDRLALGLVVAIPPGAVWHQRCWPVVAVRHLWRAAG